MLRGVLDSGGRGTLPWGPDQAYVHSICNGEGAASWLGALCVKNSENGVTESGKGVVLECSETPHAVDVHKTHFSKFNFSSCQYKDKLMNNIQYQEMKIFFNWSFKLSALTL